VERFREIETERWIKILGEIDSETEKFVERER
jgi:hypothetical protein